MPNEKPRFCLSDRFDVDEFRFIAAAEYDNPGHGWNHKRRQIK